LRSCLGIVISVGSLEIRLDWLEKENSYNGCSSAVSGDYSTYDFDGRTRLEHFVISGCAKKFGVAWRCFVGLGDADVIGSLG
jgi:hypothetical protein